MTHDDNFERDLATVVRNGAPDAAPGALGRRIEASMSAEASGARRPWQTRSSAAVVGAVALLLAIGVGGTLLAPRVPIATHTAGQLPTAGPQSPSATATSAVTAPPLPEPITDPGQVQEGELFTTNDGWVLNTDNHLFLTHSGGLAWRDVTPKGLPADASLNPSFIDPTHGWVGEARDLTKAGLVVWRTTDAGVTWSQAVLPDLRTGGWALLFQSPMVGWLATDPGAQHPKPELRWTDDGGATWSDPIDLAAATGLPVLPQLAFVDREHGAFTADGIVRVTSDGGRTWSDADMPALPSIATESGHLLQYGGPTFVDQVHGFLGITVIQADSTPATHLIYATDTAGATWHLALRDDLQRHWSFVDATTWIGIDAGQVWTTRDGGMTLDGRSSVGLPTPFDRAYMTFVDPFHGWGAVTHGHCLPGHYGCLGGPELFGTSDGGRSWTRIGDCIFTCLSPKPS
jgi:photosystem II stability/assembly factor-like uncharacterized protein